MLFTGVKTGEELADAYAQADVFVFPSKTDTFGNTILEALASGVPVAAFPSPGRSTSSAATLPPVRWMIIFAMPVSRRFIVRRRRRWRFPEATAGKRPRGNSSTMSSTPPANPCRCCRVLNLHEAIPEILFGNGGRNEAGMSQGNQDATAVIFRTGSGC